MAKQFNDINSDIRVLMLTEGEYHEGYLRYTNYLPYRIFQNDALKSWMHVSTIREGSGVSFELLFDEATHDIYPEEGEEIFGIDEKKFYHEKFEIEDNCFIFSLYRNLLKHKNGVFYSECDDKDENGEAQPEYTCIYNFVEDKCLSPMTLDEMYQELMKFRSFELHNFIPYRDFYFDKEFIENEMMNACSKTLSGNASRKNYSRIKKFIKFYKMSLLREDDILLDESYMTYLISILI